MFSLGFRMSTVLVLLGAHSALAASLCGQLVNVKGSTKPTGFVVAADERALLPRDPFGLRMFDIHDLRVLDAVTRSTRVSLSAMLELSRSEYLPLKKKNLFVCLDDFQSHNQSSAGGFILVVDSAEKFRLWEESTLVYSSSNLPSP
jgi:hypothetical protein